MRFCFQIQKSTGAKTAATYLASLVRIGKISRLRVGSSTLKTRRDGYTVIAPKEKRETGGFRLVTKPKSLLLVEKISFCTRDD